VIESVRVFNKGRWILAVRGVPKSAEQVCVLAGTSELAFTRRGTREIVASVPGALAVSVRLRVDGLFSNADRPPPTLLARKRAR
jgi:hypothetical protein